VQRWHDYTRANGSLSSLVLNSKFINRRAVADCRKGKGQVAEYLLLVPDEIVAAFFPSEFGCPLYHPLLPSLYRAVHFPYCVKAFAGGPAESIAGFGEGLHTSRLIALKRFRMQEKYAF
jgi:hypothetical protein